MGEFRIGRKYAQHFYPERQRSGAAANSLARNYARGPDGNQDIATSGAGGTQVLWDYVESEGGVVAPTTEVPITPLVTGRLLYKGVATVKNNSLTPTDVTLQIQIDGSSIAVPLIQETIPASSLATLPFEILDPTLYAIGTSRDVEVFLTSTISDGGVFLTVDSTSIEIEEVPLGTS